MGRLRIDRLCMRAGPLVDESGTLLLARCHVADRPLARLVGLLATPDLAVDEGVLLTPCASVHMVGMRRPIACAFLDGEGRVMRVIDPLRPWQRASARGATAVVEGPVGAFADVRAGSALRVDSD